jgi:hypothetical protein
MADEIQIGVNLTVLNPSDGSGFADPLNFQTSLTQNDTGFHADIIEVPIAAASTVIQKSTQKPSVIAATTAALPACTYANGASGVGATLTGNANGALAAQDGITLAVNQLLLVKDQAAGLQNGIYVLTQLGDGSNPFILTRITQMDTTGEFVGTFTSVISGTVNGGTNWNCTNASAPTVGTTAITFAKSASGTSLNLGNITTPGFMYMQNLDTANSAHWGPAVSGIMIPMGTIGAGEPAGPIRIYPGVDIRMLGDNSDANTVSVAILYKLHSD